MKHRKGSIFDSEAGHVPSDLQKDSIVPNGNNNETPACHSDDDITNEKEFLVLLNQSQRTIFNICLHFTDRKPENINDLYQEIVRTLWEAWPKFKSDSATNTWVHRIAINVAVSEFRSHSRRPRFVPLENWMYDKIAEESERAAPDYHRIINDLDADENALLFLILNKPNIHEIAESLSTTEAAIKQDLYRLRKHINTLKQQYEDEDE